jgi:Repeat of Unknown Function (DUF347)
LSLCGDGPRENEVKPPRQADSSGLGFTGGAILIASLIALIVLACFKQISRTLLFWSTFVFTRPLGATMGDLLTKSHEQGGFGVGTIGSSLVPASVLIVFIFATRDKSGSGNLSAGVLPEDRRVRTRAGEVAGREARVA